MNKPQDVQRQGILHEVGHILCNDMYDDAHIDLLERMAHARELDIDELDEINFFSHIYIPKKKR